MLINCIGFDPSLRNWGIAVGVYCSDTNQIVISHIDVIQPALPEGKRSRQNSLDIEASKQLFAAIYPFAKHTQVIFAEVPVGSQSSRAQTSYGICVGLLGALSALGLSVIEVTPLEVKLSSVGTKTASKDEVISWAMKTSPTINWPTYMARKEKQVVKSKAEHMADAIASIHAGVKTNQFKNLLQVLNHANQIIT